MSVSKASTSTTGRFARFVVKGRFSALFWMLLAVIALPVVVPDGPTIRRIMAVALFVVMLSGLNAISSDRRGLIIGICLAAPAVALNWAGLGLGNYGLYLASEFIYLAFFVYLAIHMLLWTLKKHQVDLETIYGAVSVYLLMALIWGIGYYTIALSDPGSIHFPAEDDLTEIQSMRVAGSAPEAASSDASDWRAISNSAQGTLMYYSFVTLTTLGYGDIYPTSDATRILAMLEATLGQLYLVILVARLVGLYTAQEMERRRKATPT